ncbi:MAG: glycoside hydrolase family 16 protein [Bacteroidetes bacterium]|nr:glycoside hydrolase family 16 protein [Bacteroidota bacterium]
MSIKIRVFIIIFLSIISHYSIAQNGNKNPVKAMFFQRYLHINSFIFSINYTLKNKIFKYYKNYNSPINKKGWNITFSDNFDSINTEKWRLGQPWGYFHQNSLHEYYSPNQVNAKNGFLFLKASKIPKAFEVKDSAVTIPYAVGLVNSDISFKQKYGYFEIRCKNPKGAATWASFWLTGATRWPPEIDIFEMFGKKGNKSINRQNSTIHYGIVGTKSRGSLIRKIMLTHNTDSVFHVYGCKWTKKSITFYTDGVKVRKQRLNKQLQKLMDDEMVIIISNGLQAEYLKYLPENFSKNEFIIDWIRVYKKEK